MNIPITKPYIGEEEIEGASEAIRSGWVSQGPRVKEFEDAICSYTGASHGMATTSCTTSLFLLLHLLESGEGDEVIVPALSFIATANSVRHTGATPVFCHVERDPFNL